MSFFDNLVETNIRAAAERGAFDDLPGAGKPLPEDEARHVPPELRAAYRLLRNSGHIPPEIEQAREVRQLRDLLAASREDSAQADRAIRRLRWLETTLASSRHGRGLLLDCGYDESVRTRLAGAQWRKLSQQ